MWFEFFMLGSVWFWILAIIEFFVLLVFVEDENGGGAIASVVVFLLLIHLFGNASIFSYIKANPWNVFRFAAIYATAGFVWSMIKFYFHIDKLKREVNRIKEMFIKQKESIISMYRRNNGIRDDATIDEEALWKSYLNDQLVYDKKAQLSFGSNSTKILFWLTYWPASMAWTLLNDPVRRFFKWAYNKFLIGIYRNIHKAVLGDVYKL